MGRDAAAEYVRENFEPGDRLAVVLLNKCRHDVIQRIASAERIAQEDFQAWLRFQNAQGYDVHISMNALGDGARGRTKADVQTIRHIYLDLDDGGTAAVDTMLAREDLPKPNYLINTSSDHWQVIWKVQGFGKEQAEHLQHALVRDIGADPAATDCARVLRLPGFRNHKYDEPFWVASQTHADATYQPQNFPTFPAQDRHPLRGENGQTEHRRPASGRVSQSERDWAYAKRALARGESPALVAAAIANYRRFDKHDPRYYAELTVRNASASLEAERIQSAGPERD